MQGQSSQWQPLRQTSIQQMFPMDKCGWRARCNFVHLYGPGPVLCDMISKSASHFVKDIVFIPIQKTSWSYIKPYLGLLDLTLNIKLKRNIRQKQSL